MTDPVDDSRRFPVDGDLGAHEPEAHPSYGEVVAFFGHIAYIIPGLRDVLASHLRDAEGEVLPTLLMDDVTQWLLGELRGGTSPPSMRLLATLDSAYGEATPELQSIIMLGFLEQLPGFAGRSPDPEGLGATVRAGLGPTLTAVLREVESWRSPGPNARG